MAFRPIDRDTDHLLPPSVQEWLPQTHFARYVVDVIEGPDLSALEPAYAGRGSEAYHPATLLGILIYGYATGTYSSRKIERATYDSLAFRYIACNRHPDHDTLATFRRRFGEGFQSVFVQVLEVARVHLTGGLVRDAPVGQHLVAAAIGSGNRDGSVCPGGGRDLWRTLGHRTLVSQSEALVGCDEFVAAVEGSTGVVDADSFDGVCVDAIARPASVGVLSVDGHRALAQGGNDHRGTLRPVDANSIYQASRARRLGR